MISLLLIIIYVAFISLGLPDSLLGSAWPVMQTEIGVPVSYAGILTMITCGGTIISSLYSAKLIKRFGTGIITAVSVLLTALAMFGFVISKSYLALCFFSIPYGIGAGAIDAALNNYVAVNYSSRHMSWLHAFWGVGVTISPYIMSVSLQGDLSWRGGYLTVAIIQSIFVLVLFLSVKLWKREESSKNEQNTKALSVKQALKIKGAPLVLIAFFAYCAVETTVGLWATTYLTLFKKLSVETASACGAVFFLGITVGRFLNGIIADKFGDKTMIRVGILVLTLGIILVAIPIKSSAFAIVGLLIIGLGCAPIYPSIIHSTPSNFGTQNSQALVGIQMASAYVGSTFMPPIFGFLAQFLGIQIFAYFNLIFTVLMFVMLEILNKKVKKC